VLVGLLPVLDVHEAMRRPQPLERIWHAGEVGRGIRRHTVELVGLVRAHANRSSRVIT
jgi:hypothetical protein